MRTRRSRPRRRRRSRRRNQELSSAEHTSDSSRAPAPRPRQPSAFYAAGPVLSLGATSGQTERDSRRDKESAPSVSRVRGRGSQRLVTATGKTIRLRGRTDAQFDGGRYWTDNVRVGRGQGCKNCPPSDCIRVKGRLVARYRVNTTVTLPSADDYPNLTPCQRQRVQAAIDNNLAPHEQARAKAFETYNGTTQRQFDLTLGRNEFEDTIRSMFQAEERERREAAQSASDALAPFHVDVDLNCEDEPGAGEGEEHPDTEE